MTFPTAHVSQEETAAGVAGGTDPVKETGEPETGGGGTESTVGAPAQGPCRQGHTEVMASVRIPFLSLSLLSLIPFICVSLSLSPSPPLSLSPSLPLFPQHIHNYVFVLRDLVMIRGTGILRVQHYVLGFNSEIFSMNKTTNMSVVRVQKKIVHDIQL